jgi:RimJ/RimL family protein N-acetyltransferase
MNPILRDIPSAFASERLDIRAPRPGDGAALHAAIEESFGELKPWMPWAREKMSAEQCEVLMREAQARFILRQDLWLLLFEKETNHLVGSSGLHRIDWAVPSFEIGYWARTPCTGKGYITEAVRAIADFAFQTLSARRVLIECDETNQRSCKVAERAGFAIESRQRQCKRRNDGTLADMVIYTRIA